MLLEKKEVCGKIRYRIAKIQFNKDEKTEIMNILKEKFNIQTGDTMDYIAGRRNLEDANIFMLYALAYGLDQICGSNIVAKSFTEIEIKELSDHKVKEDKVKFPIKICCVQVSNDQWIGTCDTLFLMQLRDAQLINYNKNTQRTMQKVIKGDNEFYRIAINKAAVNNIEESLNSNSFIPNTITLNIPDTEFDFAYDSEKKELIINSLPYFDITDGYHRYLALSRMHDKNDEFNYPLELRITNFPENKTKQFIYQEDQKTKMRKIDSDSMNMEASYNILVERLNSNISFYWSGDISRNEGRINFAELAKIIQFFYYKKSLGIKVNDRKYTFDLERELINKLNVVIAANDTLMEDNVNFAKLYLIFYCVYTFADINEANSHIVSGLAKANDLMLLPEFKSKNPRKGLNKFIEEII